jgi:hypothetical protein
VAFLLVLLVLMVKMVAVVQVVMPTDASELSLWLVIELSLQLGMAGSLVRGLVVQVVPVVLTTHYHHDHHQQQQGFQSSPLS